METVIERKIDYMLRYSADIPADETKLHKAFNRDCNCSPDVDFNDETGWHNLTHKPAMSKPNRNQDKF